MVMTSVVAFYLSLVFATCREPVRSTADQPADAGSGAGGAVPSDAAGRPLNLDFEKGTLADWKAEGSAFDGQPVEGDTVSQRRGDMHSRHAGRFWVGTYERERRPRHGHADFGAVPGLQTVRQLPGRGRLARGHLRRDRQERRRPGHLSGVRR